MDVERNWRDVFFIADKTYPLGNPTMRFSVNLEDTSISTQTKDGSTDVMIAVRNSFGSLPVLTVGVVGILKGMRPFDDVAYEASTVNARIHMSESNSMILIAESFDDFTPPNSITVKA